MPLSVAILLAHALLRTVAEREGIRILFIKGPVLELQGLRDPKVSADVDVWVDPSRFDDLIVALSAIGWGRRPESKSWQRFITHSVTLVRAGWPCDIDVHDRFPGAFIAPESAFEALWTGRTEAQLAVGAVDVPSVPQHAVIALLHALRDAAPQRQSEQLRPILSALRSWPAARLVALGDAATALGAEEVLAETLIPLGVQLAVPADPSGDMLIWRLRRSDAHHSVDWALELMTAQRGQRLSVLKAAIFPSRSDVAADHPARSSTPIERGAVRAKRLLRAGLAVPRIVRALRVARLEEARRAFAEDRNARIHDSALAAASIHPGTPEELTSALAPVEPAAAVDTDALPAARAGLDRQTPAIDALIVRSTEIVELSTNEADYVLDLAHLERSPLMFVESASLIWHAVTDEGCSRAEVVATVATGAGLDPEIVRADVEHFLAQLIEFGVAHTASATVASVPAASAKATPGTKKSRTAATSATSPPIVRTSR